MRQPEFIHTYGVMGSGKTMAAIQRQMTLARRRYVYAITKPSEDWRGGQTITTRFGEVSRPIDFITSKDDGLVERTMQTLAAKERLLEVGSAATNLALIIDEVNFMSPAQVAEANTLVNDYGVNVYTFGISTDFLGNPFPGEQAARTFADRTLELQADCYGWRDDGDCSNDASYNARLVNGVYVFQGDQVAINEEGEETRKEAVTIYRSLCRACYEIARLESQR